MYIFFKKKMKINYDDDAYLLFVEWINQLFGWKVEQKKKSTVCVRMCALLLMLLNHGFCGLLTKAHEVEEMGEKKCFIEIDGKLP